MLLTPETKPEPVQEEPQTQEEVPLKVNHYVQLTLSSKSKFEFMKEILTFIGKNEPYFSENIAHQQQYETCLPVLTSTIYKFIDIYETQLLPSVLELMELEWIQEEAQLKKNGIYKEELKNIYVESARDTQFFITTCKDLKYQQLAYEAFTQISLANTALGNYGLTIQRKVLELKQILEAPDSIKKHILLDLQSIERFFDNF